MSATFQRAFFNEGHTSGLNQVQPSRLVLVLVACSVVIFVRQWLLRVPKANFPLLNPAKGFALVDVEKRKEFSHNAARLLREGEATNSKRPFNIMTNSGEITILPPEMADKLRSDANLDFLDVVADDAHGHLPGFEAFGALREQKLLLAVINKHLTKQLVNITKPLSTESGHAVQINLGSSSEWQPIATYERMLDIVARMSSRMFLGEELCRNPKWLECTKMYTVLSFKQKDILDQYPPWMRPLMNRVLPGCKNLRDLRTRASEVVMPVIRKRQMEREEAIRSGKPVPRYEDTIDWFDQEGASTKVDPATLQLMLSFVAIHTTSDLLTETLFQLAQRPQLVHELRKEISEALKADGWKKQTLYNMKLLDSVIKEAQRMRPISQVSMNRRALVDVKLPTGEILPEGARIATSMSMHHDADHYDDPMVFKGHRFIDWRGTDRENASNLVSTGPASLGFGHGKHACPGRFFASNEIKIALCHLLIKYDWELPTDQDINAHVVGFSQVANSQAKVNVRMRVNVEVNIDSVE
jgi:hypothetical protein